MSFFTRIDIEKNKFIQGLDLSNAGTLVEDFIDDLLRIQSELSYHYDYRGLIDGQPQLK